MSWRPGSELRLLVVTVLVSVAALAVLARFRYPQQETASAAPAQAEPNALEKLAARAAFDELAGIVADVDRRVASRVTVLRLAPDPAHPVPPERYGVVLFRPAIHVTPDLAVVALERGLLVAGIVGSRAAPVTVGVDPTRAVALVRTPARPDFQPAVATGTLRVPSYVAVVEGTRGGRAVRPTFLARTDPLPDAAWGQSLLALGGASPAQDGSLVFALDGTFVGLVTREGEVAAVVPADAVLAMADRLSNGMREGDGSLGVELQRLSPALVKATGVAAGAVVAAVDAEGPAAGVLSVGDIVETVERQPVEDPGDVAVLTSRHAPGATVRLGVVREGKAQEVAVVLGALATAPSENELGLSLASTPGGVVVRALVNGSAAYVAGFEQGDVLSHLQGAPVQRASEIDAAFRELKPGDALIIGIRRRGRPLVVALTRPAARG